ncbi:hypothetical protein Tsubulata_011009 [Turnera subulata]|uniref:DNA-directed RNA polymerase subunit n=1 Tax=Turnera subulata TaxID=218843 RepID=A0A9Q0JKZ5_9ROSI|nr:hypothetical protein Tsubulata_011009 [Turnera subulata]
MFKELEIVCKLKVLAKNLDPDGLIRERTIITRLLEDLSWVKSRKRDGYFLAVTKLKKMNIWRGDEVDESEKALIRVHCVCRMFIPVKGETLQGVVLKVLRHGVFLRCGPLKFVYLAARKMPNYHFVSGENPAFLSDDLSRIENDVVLLFSVLDVRWVIDSRWDMTREFHVLASLEGDALGPVSLCGCDELGL